MCMRSICSKYLLALHDAQTDFPGTVKYIITIRLVVVSIPDVLV
jgi:hypothetical protein